MPTRLRMMRLTGSPQVTLLARICRCQQRDLQGSFCLSSRLASVIHGFLTLGSHEGRLPACRVPLPSMY